MNDLPSGLAAEERAARGATRVLHAPITPPHGNREERIEDGIQPQRQW